MPPLSILIWLPLACGVLGALSTFFAPPRARTRVHARAAGSFSDTTSSEPEAPTQEANPAPQRIPGALALLGTVGALGLAIGYIADYKLGASGLQHVTDVAWIPTLGIHYKLGVSGLNVLLVGLTTLLFAAAVLAANLREWDRPRLFYFHFMLAESAVLGAFLAQDLALFVAFFDLMLIPFYFLIGGWGEGPDRVKATINLVIYTMVVSVMTLAAG